GLTHKMTNEDKEKFRSLLTLEKEKLEKELIELNDVDFGADIDSGEEESRPIALLAYSPNAALAEKARAIIFVSSDLKELMAVCDRIMVMSAGRIAATFDRGQWSREKITSAAFSGYIGAS
ncbi:MAG: hypothetical protein AAB403_03515, partial [Planctomycetota bacterium]